MGVGCAPSSRTGARCGCPRDAQVAVTYRPSWYTLAVEEEWRRPPRASGRRGRW